MILLKEIKKGTFITCKCGNCYIDETEYYVRVGASKIEDIEEIKDDKKKEE